MGSRKAQAPLAFAGILAGEGAPGDGVLGEVPTFTPAGQEGGQKESHVSSHELSMVLPWWGASGFWVSRGYSCSEGCSPFQPLGAETQTYSVRSWPRASFCYTPQSETQ